MEVTNLIDKISKWKIKLTSDTEQSFDILIGIGPNNPNDEIYFFKKCWSFVTSKSELILLSDKSMKYKNHSGRLKEGDIVEVNVDRKKGDLSFSVNGKDYGLACSEIPKDEVLYPTVIIHDQNKSVEII